MQFETKQTPLPFVFAQRHSAQAQAFFNDYEPYTVVTCPEQKMTGLKPKAERVCRFCKKRMPAVRFKKDAHVFSHLIGNRYLFSDFECDVCNEVFARYENDLAYFLGPLLSFQGVKGKKKLKSFKSADKRLRVDEIVLPNGVTAIVVEKTDPDDPSLSLSRQSGVTSIRYTKGSYSPLKVYKAVLKMALCCLPDSDMPQYENAIRYLLSDNFDHTVKGIQRLVIHQKPFSFGDRSPLAVTFKKIKPDAILSTHVFILLFGNVVYQLQIPMHLEDIKLFYGEKEKQYTFPVCPPFFADRTTAELTPTTVVVKDLWDAEMVRGEVENLTMEASPEDLAKAGTYDPKTKTFSKEAEMSEIVKLIMVKEHSNTTIDDVADLLAD